jgi:hypothetical protein
LDFDGHSENRDQTEKFTLEEVLEELEKVKDVYLGKHGRSKKQKHGKNVELIIYNRKAGWWNLPYWKDLLLLHNLDVMHIENNICDNLLWTLLKVEGRTKDTINTRLDLHDMDIRPEYLCVQEGNSLRILDARYVLKQKHREQFCKFLKGVKFPDDYAANLAKSISLDGTKVVGKLKTHAYHCLLLRIIPVCLRGFVPKDVYEAILELGNFFKKLCSRTLRKDVMKKLKEDIPLILCKFEKIFPPTFFDVMVHLVVHLPDEALLRGPVQYGWMYPIELRLGTLKKFLRNRLRPEGSIMEAYLESEMLAFWKRYVDDAQTRYNRDINMSHVGPSDGDTSIFMHGVKLIGRLRYNPSMIKLWTS